MSAPLYSDVADAPEGGVAHWVDTPDGKRLRFATWNTGDRGTILVFPGRSEYIEKYGRVVGQFAKRGFSSLVIDWRGQGLSTRPDGNAGLGHVDHFSDYQTDLKSVLAHPAIQTLPKPHVLLAHSMGGCIGLRALHEKLDVAHAIFSAPMWGVGTTAGLHWTAQVLSFLMCNLGMAKKHPPKNGPEYYIVKQPFEGNVLTNSSETYEWLKHQLKTHSDLGLGGFSAGWIRQALDETKALAAMPPPCQALTFLGDQEAVVSSGAIRKQMAKPGAGRLIVCPTAQHEILMETGPVQDRAWAEIDNELRAL